MVSDGIRQPALDNSRLSFAVELGLLTGIWVLNIAIVNPIGEFPIIDDGLYEAIVNHVLATGEFPNPEPASATLLTNIFWGVGFCFFGGVSFTALRLSTLVASLLGLFGVSVLGKGFGLPRHIRLLLALTLAFSPPYHALSFTFMTDVPFTAVVIWSSVFFMRSLRSGSLTHLAAAAILSVVATLSRQIALALPLAYAICFLLKKVDGLSWRKVLQALAPAALSAATLWEYFHVLASTHRLPITYNFFSNMMMSTLTHGSALATIPFINIYITVLYAGLFLLPVLPVLLVVQGGTSRYRGKTFWFILALCLSATSAGALVRMGRELSNLVPLPESHILVPSGIGLLWLRGAQSVPGLPSSFWDLVTFFAVIGSILLLGQLSLVCSELLGHIRRRSLSSEPQLAVLFLMLSGIILLCPYLFSGASDRYLTPALPLLAVAAAASTSLWWQQEGGPVPIFARAGAAVVLLGTMIFSVAGTRDYLAWHRISAMASADLIERGRIRPQQIDGGEEFNAYHPAYQGRENEIDFSDLDSSQSGYVVTNEIKSQAKVVERMAWRPSNVQYIVGFDSVPGYSVIQEYSYYNWMPPHVQRICVLQRK